MKAEYINKVSAVFDTYPAPIRKRLLSIRDLIFTVARETPQAGKVEETLKWGEPAYLTRHPKSGSTIRLAWKQSTPSKYMIYFNCKTTLIQRFKEIFGDIFQYEGKRGIVLDINDKPHNKFLAYCIELALTYHTKKKN